MDASQHLITAGLVFVALNIILPLGAFLFWLVVKIPGPLKRLVRKCLNY